MIARKILISSVRELPRILGYWGQLIHTVCHVKTEDEAETLNFPLCENYASNVIFIII